MLQTDALYTLAETLGRLLQDNGVRLALAESCTGGWIAQSITEIAGSSAWFDRGFVTYSNEAKTAMLGVVPETLSHYGAVSRETATAMVQGALTNSLADVGLAVTGIAGPGGGTAEKPVGLVYIAWQRRGYSLQCREHRFPGNRHEIRRQTVHTALEYLILAYSN